MAKIVIQVKHLKSFSYPIIQSRSFHIIRLSLLHEGQSTAEKHACYDIFSCLPMCAPVRVVATSQATPSPECIAPSRYPGIYSDQSSPPSIYRRGFSIKQTVQYLRGAFPVQWNFTSGHLITLGSIFTPILLLHTPVAKVALTQFCWLCFVFSLTERHAPFVMYFPRRCLSEFHA